MTLPADRLLAAMAATWPPAATERSGPWLLRDGRGGGNRVSAATAEAAVVAADVEALEALCRDRDTPPLVMVRADEVGLDALLDRAGWSVVDPVVLYVAPVEALAGPLPPASAFCAWPPLAIMRAIWAEGGIGPERLAVMARAPQPRAALVVRANDRAAGAAFVAVSDGIAMVHAVEVRHRDRRAGARTPADARGGGVGRAARRRPSRPRGHRGKRAGPRTLPRARMTEAARYHYRSKEVP